MFHLNSIDQRISAKRYRLPSLLERVVHRGAIKSNSPEFILEDLLKILSVESSLSSATHSSQCDLDTVTIR